MRHNWLRFTFFLKHRIGQRFYTHCDGDPKTLVEISGYRRDYNTHSYGCRILEHKNKGNIGFFITRLELELLPIYKFDVNDKKQLFGYIGDELRRNGVLKTQT